VYEEVSAVRPVFLVQQKDVLLEDVQRFLRAKTKEIE
jgi:hypothetical protein